MTRRTRRRVVVLFCGIAAALVAGELSGERDREATRAETKGGATTGRQAARRTLDSVPRPTVFRPRRGHILGHSARGRPIRLSAFGDPRARRKVMVIGCIHGTECAGREVARRLVAGCPPSRADLWVVENLNLDGFALKTRLNGRGVDLNRNFPSGWRAIGQRWDPEYSGPKPLSEPETQITRRLIRAVRPEVTIWFHQQAQPLVRAWGHRFPGTSSFVVELPPGPLERRDSVRYAAAIERFAGYVGENRLAVEGARRFRPPQSLRLARRPYMGVACRVPNSIECDRVGLAVYLPKRKRATGLTASINGRSVRMRVPAGVATRGGYFEGFLYPAGLKTGPLKLTEKEPVFARVRITARYRDGNKATTVRRVGLAAGWG